MARIAQTKCCIICGHEVLRPRLSDEDIPALAWKQRYRIVYQDLQFSTRLSGLASHRDARGHSWYAPWDHDDTREYAGIANLPEHESIRVMDYHSSSENYLRYGFPAHENCWSLLRKVYSPATVPYDMIFNVCKSLEGPQPDRILDWGHDYGGALQVTYGDRIEGRNVDDRRDAPEFFKQDPCSSEDIEGLIRQSSKTPPSGAEVSPEISLLNDCLSSLPSDVRFLVANLLPTADLHALRLASRAFYFIFHQQSFWALKFNPGGDRDWLFEAIEIAKVRKVDWRSLYKTTSQLERLPPSLRNRSRIWNLAKLIRDATPYSTIKSVTRPSIFGPDCEFDVWASVTSSQQDAARSSENSPKLKLPRQKFQLPGPLEEIQVHFVRLGPVEFISGITFLMTSSRSRHIGYKSGSVRRLKLHEDPIGFNLKLEYLGIISIQAVYSNGDMSEWLGDGLDMPTTRRLVLHDKITAVEGVFDGFKLIKLSFSRHPPKTMKEEEAMRKIRSSVFHSGIWYPEMPDMTANLHEKFAILPYDFHPTLKGEAVSGSRYLPLCFTRFGGKDGQLLGSLSRVSGKLDTAIVFTYKSDDVPPLERSWPMGYGYRATEHPYFQINGERGEWFVRAILTIEGNLEPSQNPFIHGVLSSATLITDRGREYELCNYGLQYGGPHIPFELRLHPHEAITGIYGVPGGMSLGIVSEKAIDKHPWW